MSIAATDALPMGILATTMCEENSQLKERLISIMNFKKTSISTIALSLVLLLMLTGCASIGGVGQEVTPTPEPDKIPDGIINPTESELTVMSGGDEISLIRPIPVDRFELIAHAKWLPDVIDELPAIALARDIHFKLPERLSISNPIIVYDENFNSVYGDDDYFYGINCLYWLDTGIYYVVLEVIDSSTYISAGDNLLHSATYNCVFELTVDSPLYTAEFSPTNESDIVSAELMLNGVGYTLINEDLLALLRVQLSEVTENSATDCPFASPIYLTYADGSVSIFSQAEDGCNMIFSNGKQYQYPGDAFNFYWLFGLHQVGDDFVSAEYATDELLANYESFGESEKLLDYFAQRILVTTTGTMTNFRLFDISLADNPDEFYFTADEALYKADELTPEKPQVIWSSFPGLFPTSMISFVDGRNVTHYFSLTMSGIDGSIVLSEMLRTSDGFYAYP